MGGGSGVRASSRFSIAISFEYRGQQCREKIKLAPTPANLKYCANLKARIEQEITFGSFDYAAFFPKSPKARALAKNPAKTLTVGELFTEWLKHVRKTLEPETYGDYAEYIQKTWRPRFGPMILSDFTVLTVYGWIGEQTCGKKRILNLLTPLRQAMRYAVKPAKLLTADPLAGIKVERPDEIEDEGDELIDPFSKAEIDAILPHLDPQEANMFEFWVWQGPREGELIALRWTDIDFDQGTARITKSARGARRKAPKTRAGRRTIKLLPPALEALQRQKTHTRMLHKEIFLNPGTREPWGNDKSIRVRWHKACEAAKVRYRPPRHLRHTYATWMLMSREDPLWVSREMGHANVAITLKIYTKYIPGMNPNAGMAAYRMISGSRSEHDKG